MRLESDGKRLTLDREMLTGELQALDRKLTADRTERDTLLATLDPDWQARSADLTDDDLGKLAAERADLETDGTADRFAALRADADGQAGWADRRSEAAAELAALPAGTVAGAEAALAEFTAAAQAADTVRDTAVADLDRLTRQSAELSKLLAGLKAAEADHDRHRKLAAWLGKEGLLRDLVRGAERDIVRHARDTIRTLSGGDLEIELQAPSDGKDEALVLLVKQADKPLPTPVKFLSGSQKFRVAVALAVAIGKFAAGSLSARPLESVIIDEGFGGLDRDGLENMRRELDNLKDSQALKRIILVSHQDEFAASFPVGYRLSAGENGTIATRFRRSGND
jgi:DNA repair exonuclease SbcCD ATPase subunit